MYCATPTMNGRGWLAVIVDEDDATVRGVLEDGSTAPLNSRTAWQYSWMVFRSAELATEAAEASDWEGPGGVMAARRRRR